MAPGSPALMSRLQERNLFRVRSRAGRDQGQAAMRRREPFWSGAGLILCDCCPLSAGPPGRRYPDNALPPQDGIRYLKLKLWTPK